MPKELDSIKQIQLSCLIFIREVAKVDSSLAVPPPGVKRLAVRVLQAQLGTCLGRVPRAVCVGPGAEDFVCKLAGLSEATPEHSEQPPNIVVSHYIGTSAC